MPLSVMPSACVLTLVRPPQAWQRNGGGYARASPRSLRAQTRWH